VVSSQFVLCFFEDLLIVFALFSLGKTTFLKALAGQLTVGSAHLEGEILYNGDPIDCGKFLVGKVATYADEREQHAGVLTVRETMDFAWQSTTGGHHSYNIAKDAASAAVLDKDDEAFVKVGTITTSSFF
jgi:ABC-type multidrug transport system ATPase subunit